MADEGSDDLKKRYDDALAAYERSRKFYIEYVLDGFPPAPVMPANLEDVHDVENWRVAWNAWVNLDGIQERRHPLSEISKEELLKVVSKEKAFRRDVLAYRAQQEFERVLGEITKMEDEWRASDPDYKKKNAILYPILKSILRTLPTSKWKEVVQLGYGNTPVATITQLVDQETLEKQTREQEERWRAADEELRKVDAIQEARERLTSSVYGGDVIAHQKKNDRKRNWHEFMLIGCYGVLCALFALLVSEIALHFFMATPPWWKVLGALVLTLLGAHIFHMVATAATVAIAWKLGGQKLRLTQLLEWMVANDMPPRSEAMLWAKEFHSEAAEELTLGYFYIYWLSHGRFGSSQQVQAAMEYIAAHEKLGWFEQGREKDVVRDATIRYFALLDEYLPSEKGA